MKNKKIMLHIFLAIVLLIGGFIGMRVLSASKPEMEKETPPVPVPMAKTVAVSTGVHSVEIAGQGTVGVVREIQLIPEVSGKVVMVSPHLVNGGTFEKGEVLLEIDPSDYKIAVTSAEARVKDAESAYKLAKEEASAALFEWRQLNPSDDPPSLVAKEPQLAAAEAMLAAEKANLEKARLQLARTRLTAPFAGRVREEQVDVGQYVAPGQRLAVLYGTEAFEISVPLESDDLYWFHVPGFTSGNGQGAPARVVGRMAGAERTWDGYVDRVEGSVDARTRMVNIVIRVKNPASAKPPLMPGMFVQVRIKGRALENAAVIPRAALRGEQTVWVVNDDGILEFRSIKIARFSLDGVVVQEGLKNGEHVVVSPIKAVTSGMRVRRVGSPGEAAL